MVRWMRIGKQFPAPKRQYLLSTASCRLRLARMALTPRYVTLFYLLTVICFTASFYPVFAQTAEYHQEEAQDYYEKWLKEDVVYIITDEERAVFQSLSTPDEKERFIEQFWKRRDTDPATAVNEFKEEHYRRIAFANERFHAGIAGWRTDRGKVYIIHGPPDEREQHLAGENYRRTLREGGGSTKTYPFERWRYRHIEGIGTNVEIEFVDSTLDGNYTLALNPEEKDAFLYAPTLGMTLAEEAGLASREDRPFFRPSNRFHYPLSANYGEDSPFRRYELYTQIQKPVALKYHDLKRLVDVNVSYEDLSLTIEPDFFLLNEEEVLAPISIEIDNRELTFDQDESGNYQGKIAIYGSITTLSNELITSFEDDLEVSFPSQSRSALMSKSSLYQKIVMLPNRGRFKLDLAVKDLNGGRIGIASKSLVPPQFSSDTLSISSVVLADQVRRAGVSATPDEMFVIGDLKVRPNLRRRFHWFRPLTTYLQVYHADLDQQSYSPQLDLEYRILQEGELIKTVRPEAVKAIQFASSRRIVLVQEVPLDDLETGPYRLEVRITDQIGEQTVSGLEEFEVTDPPATEPIIQ